jgi:UPF0755 protein
LSQENSEAVKEKTNSGSEEGVSGKKNVKLFRILFRTVVILLILTVAVLAGLQRLAEPCDRTKATYSDFVIEEGDDINTVAEKLDEAGIVRSASSFELLAKLSLADDFRPGTYFLSPSMDGLNIIHTLQKGLTTPTGFTIPAGYTVDQIATALDRDGLADKDAVLAAAASPALAELEILSDDSKGLKGTELVEGFLLPDDYSLSSEADESMMVIMMIDAFTNFFNEDYIARADELGMSVRQVIKVASIIEKETSIDKEKPAISAVLHNRYNLELLAEDEIPKVPLCSPSKESIMAALYPEEADYTHYVLSSKLDGTHLFTSDDAEYEALLAEYNAAAEAKAAKEAAEEAAEENGTDAPEETAGDKENSGEGGE